MAFGYCLLVVFDKISTVFNVTARTEIIKSYSKQKPLSRINLFDADIYTLVEDRYKLPTDTLLAKSFNGSLELSDSVSMKMERIANGPLLLELEKPNGGNVAVLRSRNSYGAASVIDFPTDILFVEIHEIDSLINNNVSIVIPISGKIELGNSIDIESDGEYSLLLRSGDVTMTGYTSFNGNYFVAGQERLFLGDKLVFDDENAIGVATINDEPALQVSYRAIGNEARIIKPGPRDNESAYVFSASLFSRFKYDKFFQGLSIILAIVLSVTSIGDFYMNHLRDGQKSEK